MVKCVFNGKWKADEKFKAWIAADPTSKTKAMCVVCNKAIDISSMGETAGGWKMLLLLKGLYYYHYHYHYHYLKCKKKIREKDCYSVKADTKTFLIALVKKLLLKAPIRFGLVLNELGMAASLGNLS